jgi:hypothetical protein
MELLMFGLNILLLIVLWHFVVKRTVIDHARDRLFDLRDAIRTEHIANGWGLDSAAYKNLRKMLNAYLRYTESYSIWKIVAIHGDLSQNQELREHIRKRVNTSFSTLDGRQAEYIQSVRDQAFVVLTEFSICHSGLLIILSLVMMPYFLLQSFASICSRGIKTAFDVIGHDLLHLTSTLKRIWKISAKAMASRLVDRTAFDAAVINHRQQFA